MNQAAELWRFFVGVLTGAALCAVLLGKLFSLGLRHSSQARDRLRAYLNSIDGWPLVFCRTCATFISTAPGDEEEEEHCLGQRCCFVRHLTFVDEPQCVEVQGPLCRVCDELLRIGPEIG